MKLKNIVVLSVIVVLLISILQQIYFGYAMGTIRAKTETTLNACFKKAFDRTVDDQVNNLPLPEGTVTHIIYMPVNPGETPEEEDFSFYTSQQTAAILQEVYDTEIPLDTLLMNLERDLRSDGVDGKVYLRISDVQADTILQMLPAYPRQGFLDMEFVSDKAYLNKDKGIVVEGQVIFSLRQGNLFSRQFWATVVIRCLSVLIIIGFFLRVRSLQRQQINIACQRAEFYRQAKELEVPICQVKSDMVSARWMPVYEMVRKLLASVETTLTHAKQENARINKRRVFRPLLWSGMAICGIFLLTVLWGFFFYAERWHEVLHQTQVAFEEAFVSESWQRYDRLHQQLSAQGRPTSRLTGSTDYPAMQLDSLLGIYWFENDSVGNPQGPHIHTGYAYVKQGGLYMNENARVRRAYTNQYYFVTMGEPYIPLDRQCMDSLFKVRQHREKLPAGYLHFFHSDGDSLSSHWSSIVTPSVSTRNDRTEWMQGVVPFSLSYVVGTDWYLFLSLGLMFFFTVFCIYIQWRIARRQRQLEQFRRDFTYAMIHDMKSPFQSVLMGAQIMASGRIDPASEKASRLLTAMNDECDHLLSLSARVVMLTQLERGELQLHQTDIALRPLLEDLAAKFSLKATKPVTFSIDCPTDFHITADAFCMREVLSNLVDNALKYSRESVHISLSAVRTNGNVYLSVRDNGIGISPRDRRRIFGKFERVVSGSRATGASGFGLGLNFVWQVVRAHGGTVSVLSDGRSYSEFRIELSSHQASVAS